MNFKTLYKQANENINPTPELRHALLNMAREEQGKTKTKHKNAVRWLSLAACALLVSVAVMSLSQRTKDDYLLSEISPQNERIISDTDENATHNFEAAQWNEDFAEFEAATPEEPAVDIPPTLNQIFETYLGSRFLGLSGDIEYSKEGQTTFINAASVESQVTEILSANGNSRITFISDGFLGKTFVKFKLNSKLTSNGKTADVIINDKDEMFFMPDSYTGYFFRLNNGDSQRLMKAVDGQLTIDN